MLKLLRKSDNPNLTVIRKPSYFALLPINTHSNDRFILKPQFSRDIRSLSSRIDISPQTNSNKMLTINIRVILNKSITKTNNRMLWNSLYLYLEIYLPLFWHRMFTINNTEKIWLLLDLISLKLVRTYMFRIWIRREDEYLSILLTLVHRFLHLFRVVYQLLVHLQPAYFDLFVQCALYLSLLVVRLDIFIRNKVLFMKSLFRTGRV